MKKAFRILSVVLAAIMLIGCCVFAIDDEKRPLMRDGYGCSCGPNACSAYTFVNDPVGYIYVDYAGTITRFDNSEFTVADMAAGHNYPFVSCGERYSTAAAGWITSTHLIENAHYYSGDGF